MAINAGIIIAFFLVAYIALVLSLFWCSQRRHSVLYEGGYPPIVRRRFWRKANRDPDLEKAVAKDQPHGLRQGEDKNSKAKDRRSIATSEELGVIHPAYVPSGHKAKGGELYFGPRNYYPKGEASVEGR